MHSTEHQNIRALDTQIANTSRIAVTDAVQKVLDFLFGHDDISIRVFPVKTHHLLVIFRAEENGATLGLTFEADAKEKTRFGAFISILADGSRNTILQWKNLSMKRVQHALFAIYPNEIAERERVCVEWEHLIIYKHQKAQPAPSTPTRPPPRRSGFFTRQLPNDLVTQQAILEASERISA